MSWDIQVRDGVAVAVMRSNPVNKMNPGFFDDLHAALDAIERDHPRLPLVLTAEGNTFSAGLDFEDVFPRFAKNDAAELRTWFERFRGSLMRVFTLPRRTIAAINGNALAGGLILALSCDVRIAAEGGARFAINEVPVGIPMPGVYTEIVRYAVGARSAAEAILGGQLYDVPQALAAGFLHQVVPAERLLDQAVKLARVIPPDSSSAYAMSKQALLQPSLKWMASDGAELDEQAMRVVMAPDSVRAQRAALERLKKKS